MAGAARAAGVPIVGGDTKVVEHGKADRMYITTTGIGAPIARRALSAALGAAGRPGPPLRADRRSRHHDPAGARRARSRSRSALRHALGVPAGRGARRGSGGPGLRWMRDPTRGGVATSLNELARDCGLGDRICSRRRIPGARRGARRLRAARPRSAAHRQRRTVPRGGRAGDAPTRRSTPCERHPAAKRRAIIGEVREQPRQPCWSTTRYGGTRIMDMLVGDPLPRIC